VQTCVAQLINQHCLPIGLLAPENRRLNSRDTAISKNQKIQSPSTTQTKPEFANPRPTYSDVVREKLKPRSEWMKCQPAEMSDSEADNAWHLGNERLFGTKPTTTSAIEHEIATLQSQLALPATSLQRTLI
jgi:hypothetical protein